MFRLTPYNTRGQVIRRNDDLTDLYSLFDDVWNNDPVFKNTSIGNGSFKVDIQDKETSFVLEAELPGVSKEDVSVDYKDGLLTIKVEKAEAKEEEKNNYIYKERRQNSLQRVFKMKGIQRDALTAKLENGILTVEAPKLDEVVNNYKVEIQ